MADLGGFVGGAMAGQEYAQSRELFGLTKQEKGLDIKEKDLEIQKSQMLVEHQKKMIKMMDGMDAKGKPGSSPTDMVDSQAQRMLQASQLSLQDGYPAEAGKLAETATLMMQHNETVAQGKTKVQLQQLKDVTDILGAAEESPKGWDQAKQMFQTMHPDEVNNPNIKQILAMPYRPGMIKLIQSGVMTAKDRALEEEAKAGTAARWAEAAEHQTRTRMILPLEAKNIQLRNEKLAQAGGDNLIPTKQDMERVTDALLDPVNGVEGIDKKTAASAALPIASAMRVYMKAGKGEAEARELAMKDARTRGDLRGLEKPMPPQVQTAAGRVDKLLGLLDEAESKGIDVTGMFGSFRRGEEYAGSKAAGLESKLTGTKHKGPEQIANQFESELTLLQLELPGIAKMPGQFSKLKREDIQTVLRGRKKWDSMSSTRSSLEMVREALGGAGARSGATPSKIAVNDKGEKMALVDGKWVPYGGR